MSYQEKADRLHKEGCNCCQAVIMACSERFGIPEEQAYRLGAFFGGGFRCEEVCGAVSGAIMGLGHAYGDENNRQCGKSVEFLEAFRKEFGSLLCRELVQPEGQEKKALCPAYIKFAANYLEEDFK